MSKRFKSPSDKPVRVVLMSGHATIIGPELKPLHERYHSQAYASGCLSEDMLKNKVADRIPTHVALHIDEVEQYEQKVYAAIQKLVEANDLDKFTKSGAPDAQILSTMVGERVTSGQRDKIWYKYQKDTGSEE